MIKKKNKKTIDQAVIVLENLFEYGSMDQQLFDVCLNCFDVSELKYNMIFAEISSPRHFYKNRGAGNSIFQNQ